jgi:hypothetical protein
LPKNPFRLSESVFDKSKARFRRLQNSPLAQTIVIADLTRRRDLLVKTLSMAAQMDIFVATVRPAVDDNIITAP